MAGVRKAGSEEGLGEQQHELGEAQRHFMGGGGPTPINSMIVLYGMAAGEAVWPERVCVGHRGIRREV